MDPRVLSGVLLVEPFCKHRAISLLDFLSLCHGAGATANQVAPRSLLLSVPSSLEAACCVGTPSQGGVAVGTS